MKTNNDNGKTHPNEQTRVASDGSGIKSIHQPAAVDEPTNKSKSPVKHKAEQ